MVPERSIEALLWSAAFRSSMSRRTVPTEQHPVPEFLGRKEPGP